MPGVVEAGPVAADEPGDASLERGAGWNGVSVVWLERRFHGSSSNPSILAYRIRVKPGDRAVQIPIQRRAAENEHGTGVPPRPVCGCKCLAIRGLLRFVLLLFVLLVLVL